MHKASQVRKHAGGHSSFRRMANYEYNHALQDLLDLKLEFTEALPPENSSEDGFKNSSKYLQMSAAQLETYREIAIVALQKATVEGDRPKVVTWQMCALRQGSEPPEESLPWAGSSGRVRQAGEFSTWREPGWIRRCSLSPGTRRYKLEP